MSAASNPAPWLPEATTPPVVAEGSAADRVAKLEAAARPLIERLAEIDAELAVPTKGRDVADEVAARRKAADLNLERAVVADHLAPISDALAVALSEAADEAKVVARQGAVGRGLAALSKVTKARRALETAVAELEANAEEDRAGGVSWGMIPELHFAGQEELTKLGSLPNQLMAAVR